MKTNIFFLLLLLPYVLHGQSVDCQEYRTIIEKVEKALITEDYKTAILKLNAAREHCPEKSGEVDNMILSVFNAIENKRLEADREKKKAKDALTRFQVSFASYLTSEAQRAFNQEDIRLAWLLVIAALEKDPNNTKAKDLKSELPKYGAEYYIGVDDPRFEISPDSNYLSFFTKEVNDNLIFNLLELKGEKTHRTFSDSYNSPARFSLDGRYLVFYTHVADSKGTLNVLELKGEKTHRTFSDSRLYSDNYSPDSHHLAFFTQENTLNVLELGGKKTLRTFPECDEYSHSYSLDSQHLVFFTHGNILNVLALGKNNHLTFLNCYGRGRTIQFEEGDPYSFKSRKGYSFSLDNRHLVFFSQVSNYTGTLNVLELGREYKTQTFSNSYFNIDRDSYSYSPNSAHLVFYTQVTDGKGLLNVLDLGEEKKLRTFPESDSYIASHFSPDNRHLVFFTQVAEGKSTLNLLELEGENSHRTFPESDQKIHNDRNFSPDSRYLVFFTNVVEGKGTLNLLELTGEKKYRTFPESHKSNFSFSQDSRHLLFFTQVAVTKGMLNLLELEGENSHRTFFESDTFFASRFSPDSRHLVFYTQTDFDKHKLNVLELRGEKTHRTFLESHKNNFSFSPDSRFMVIFTKVFNGIDTLNLLELGGKKTHRAFPCSYTYNDKSREIYSHDGRHLAYLEDYRKTIVIFDLNSGKTLKKKNYFEVDDFKFLRNNYLLTISTNTTDENIIYKLINLDQMGSGYWNYLLKTDYFKPLTAKEKQDFGIID